MSKHTAKSARGDVVIVALGRQLEAEAEFARRETVTANYLYGHNPNQLEWGKMIREAHAPAHALAREIVKMPARTLAGVTAKRKATDWINGDWR